MAWLGLLFGAIFVLIGARHMLSPAAHLGRGMVPARDPQTVRRFGAVFIGAGALIFILNAVRLAQG